MSASAERRSPQDGFPGNDAGFPRILGAPASLNLQGNLDEISDPGTFPRIAPDEKRARFSSANAFFIGEFLLYRRRGLKDGETPRFRASCRIGRMKPNFALDLNQNGIGLLHRAGANWLWLGSVPLNTPGFARRLQALRREAGVFERDGMTTKIVIPNSEILYAELHAPGPGSSARIAQIREGLRQLTPCDVEDLVFDWRPAGHHAQVAAVARETLHEAEAFAVGHRFNPISLVAVPEPDRFEGEPFFGATAHAASLLANGDLVEPDIGAMAVIGRRRRDDDDRQRQPAVRSATAVSTSYPTETANGPISLPQPERDNSATTTSDGPSLRDADGAGDHVAAKVAEKLDRDAPGGADRLGRQDITEPAAERTESERGAVTDSAQAGESVAGRQTGGISPKTAPRFAREPPPPEPKSDGGGRKSGRIPPAAANASEGRRTPGQVPANRKGEKPGSRILLLETERKARPERRSGPAAKTPATSGSASPGGKGGSGNRTRAAASQLAFSFLDDAEVAPNAPGRDTEAEESANAPSARPGEAPFVDTDSPVPDPDDSTSPQAPRNVARRGKPASPTHSPRNSDEDAARGSNESDFDPPPAPIRAVPRASIDRAEGPSGGKARTARRRSESPTAEHPAFDFDPAPAKRPGELDFGEPSATALRAAAATEKPSADAKIPSEGNGRVTQRQKSRPEAEHPALDFGDTSACKQAKLDLAAPAAATHSSPPQKPPFGGDGKADSSYGSGRAARPRSGAPARERPPPDRVATANGRSGSDIHPKSSVRNSPTPSGKPALVADGAARPSVARERTPRRSSIPAWAGAALALVALAALGAMAIGFGNPSPSDRTGESGPTGALAEPSAETPSGSERPDAEPSGASTATADLRQLNPETAPELVGDGAATAPPVSLTAPHENENAPPPSPDTSELPKRPIASPQIRPDIATPELDSGVNADDASEDLRAGAAFAAPLPRPTGRFGAVVSRAPQLRPAAPAEARVDTASAHAIRVPGAPMPRPDDIGSIAEAAFAASLQSQQTGASVASAATQRAALEPGGINLIGVYGSETGRRAIVRLQSGRFVTVETGDRMDGGRVFAIGEGELSYVKGGRNHLLRMPRG